MEKERILRLRNVAKAVMIILLFGAVGNAFAYNYDFSAVCETGQRLYYKIIDAENHYVEVTRGDTRPAGDLSIPGSVIFDGALYDVISLGELSFFSCYDLTSVVIPNSVITIGYDAFYYCIYLSSVSIGNSVNTIGIAAFQACNRLSTVYMGNSITSIGSGAFSGCDSLFSISIPSSVTSIGSGVFTNTGWYSNQPEGILYLDGWCLGYKGDRPTGTVVINSGTKGIADATFQSCTGLVNVNIPNTIISFGHYTFEGCTNLTSINIPSSLISFGNRVFKGCSNLTGVMTIPNTVTYIGENAFYNCANLTANSLIIPEGVTHIGDYAFYGCSGLSGILTIPSSVETIGRFMFKGCNFTEVNYNAVNADYDDSLGWGNYPPNDFDDCSGTLVIGNSVESIPPQLFGNCGFTNITIGTSVTTIGRGAFSGCNNAIEVRFNPTNCIHCGYEEMAFSGCTGSLIIGDNVTQIPGNAFIFASFNGTLTIGNSVATIGEAAFNSCGGFTGGLVIPNSVTEIGAWAFTGAGFDGELVIPNSLTIIDGGVFGGCGFTGELVIPNSVTTIEVSAFSGCSGFTGSLTLSNSITRIAQDCFSWCTGFTGCLEIPSSVTQIESNAFYGCSGISCISIPNTVQSIGGNVFTETGWYNTQADGILYLDDWCLGYKGSQPAGDLNIQEGTKGIAGWAFDHCSNLTGILTIPESIEKMGELAFIGCSGLTEVHYNAINCSGWNAESQFYECDGLTTLVIGDSVEIIPPYIFSGIGFEGTLNIPNSVITIGDGAFSGCAGFTGDLNIPNSVNTIGYGSFSGCVGFNGALSIGNSVTNIGNYAFYNCSGITSMTVYAAAPPTLGTWGYSYNGNTSVFTNVDKSIPVHVPYGTISAYQAASGWNEFTNYQELPAQGITQTFDLSAGWNWCSFYVDITLDDLKSALVETLPGTSITISSQTQSTVYNGTEWRGQLSTLDVAMMYKIMVTQGCEMTLEGVPVNAAEHPVTISNGYNWIAFQLSQSMSLSNAFAGFAVSGDVVSSQTQNATYNGTVWRGTLGSGVLESGKGYKYHSNATEPRTFTYPSAK